uniref:Serpentine receptor class gamma n=1 Tax=Panagrellus redivivus TaxID=6233 RepID=A0A7E4V243_PANRE
MASAAMIKAIVFAAVTTPFWFLQASVIIFLVYCRIKRWQTYTTTFFLLFLMLCFLDSFSELLNFLGLRLIAFSFTYPFMLSSTLYSSVFYLLTAYVLYTQCFIHMSIAINRLYSVYWITEDLSPKFGKLGRGLIILLPFLVIPLLIPRFFHTAIYFVNTDASLSLRYTDSGIQKYQSTTATCIIVFTALPTFIIELITVHKYQMLFKNKNVVNRKKCLQEYRLLCQAMIVLIVQVLVCIFQIMIYVSTLMGNTSLFATIMSFYAYIGDLLNLTGPVALVVVSSHFRRDYCNFWLTLIGIRKGSLMNPSTTNVVAIGRGSNIKTANTKRTFPKHSQILCVQVLGMNWECPYGQTRAGVRTTYFYQGNAGNGQPNRDASEIVVLAAVGWNRGKASGTGQPTRDESAERRRARQDRRRLRCTHYATCGTLTLESAFFGANI